MDAAGVPALLATVSLDMYIIIFHINIDIYFVYIYIYIYTCIQKTVWLHYIL